MISDAAVMTKPVGCAPSRSLGPARPVDAAQRAIVHVHAARPQDLFRIDPQVVAEMQMRIEQRRKQVMRGRDGVESRR